MTNTNNIAAIRFTIESIADKIADFESVGVTSKGLYEALGIFEASLATCIADNMTEAGFEYGMALNLGEKKAEQFANDALKAAREAVAA